MTDSDGLYIQLISVHGLVRGHDMELGRDADTGGQIKYVVEFARALGKHPDVARVDVLTRQIHDSRIDASYAVPIEEIARNTFIVRLPCGPRRYLRKEALWPHLDNFSDAALQHIRRIGIVPHLIHAHYADAGFVGARLSALLGVPLVFTGHSLGRVKRRRLLDHGMTAPSIERQFHIAERIEAEETALDIAAFVIASTHQEIEEQYRLYDNYEPRRMTVIPPGVDLEQFQPPPPGPYAPTIANELARFLREPRKPPVLAMSRPDRRKNIATLVRAYGENTRLQELANLIIIAGNREDFTAMEKEPRRIFSELLRLIDYYDLYGRVAYPKHHQPDDVPALYRLAAKCRGIFINPALTEPFGLTLLEAAASGLPIVAPADGGPRDIVRNCKNGALIDPLDSRAMSETLIDALSDRRRWSTWARCGLSGVRKCYSWEAHVARYMREIHKVVNRTHQLASATASRGRLTRADRALVCDLDNSLIGDDEALRRLLRRLQDGGGRVAFGIATGRRLESTLKVLRDWKVPLPDFLITSVGTEIRYGPQLTLDTGWQQHNDYRWEPRAVRDAMRGVPGLRLQPKAEQGLYKISYVVDSAVAPSVREIARHLRKRSLHVNLIYSHDTYLDIVPVRVSKGGAVRYVAMKWGIPVERMLVVGDAGNDEDMLSGNTLGVVVSNHSPELASLRGRERIYFAAGHHAWAILEAIDYYDFFGALCVPEEATTTPMEAIS